jgi:predicted nucleic acid-binding protein
VVIDGILIDTGPVVALLSERDQYHGVCTAHAKLLRGPFFTCWPLVTEAVYLLRDRPKIVAQLFDLLRSTRIQLLALDASDIDAISEIYIKYSDQHVDLADAALLHLAVRENLERVFTIDLRHFSVLRLREGRSLEIIPSSF